VASIHKKAFKGILNLFLLTFIDFTPVQFFKCKIGITW
jgi:hypothetical protein